MARIMESIRNELFARSLQEGFKKTKGNVFYLPGSSEDYQRTLAFSFYTYPNTRLITAYVGVRSLRVEKIYERLAGEKSRYPVLVISCNIGHISPYGHFKDWVIYEQTNRFLIYDEVFSYINKYAFPFYEKYEHLSDVIETLDNKPNEIFVPAEVRFCILPIIYLLLGNKDAGVRVMDKMIKDGFNLKQDFFKNYYNNFCKFEL